MSTRSFAAARRAILLSSMGAAAWLAAVPVQAAGPTLLNVSYDVAREFFKEINPAFQKSWKAASGEDVTINQSHGGSSKQARAVLDGLEADVVTMNQSSDIDVLATRGKLLPEDWARRLPHNAAPTTSVTVILVRKGNPKGIKDWADLARPGVSVVIPNPKITGNGRYSYVAAWGSVIKAGGTPAQAREQVQKTFANVPVFDGGGPRGDHHLRAAQHRRRAGHLRIRGEPHQGRVRRQLRGDLPEVDHPGREPGGRDRQGGRQEGHPQAGRGPT